MICLAFMNEAWGLHLIPGSNVPFWSLRYEAVYYAIFGAWYYGSGATRLLGCLVLAALAGPRILSLFPLWLMGCAASHISRRYRIGRPAGWAGFILTAVAALVFNHWARTYGIFHGSMPLFGHNAWETCQEYFLAALFAANLISFGAIPDDFAPLAGRGNLHPLSDPRAADPGDQGDRAVAVRFLVLLDHHDHGAAVAGAAPGGLHRTPQRRMAAPVRPTVSRPRRVGRTIVTSIPQFRHKHFQLPQNRLYPSRLAHEWAGR